MPEALISLRNVSLGYDGRPVLQQVSLTIERGEFLALLGPNGAGKTTLLRGVLRLIPVLAGTIEYGFDRLASPPGYVPQRETLDPIFPPLRHAIPALPKSPTSRGATPYSAGIS